MKGRGRRRSRWYAVGPAALVLSLGSLAPSVSAGAGPAADDHGSVVSAQAAVRPQPSAVPDQPLGLVSDGVSDGPPVAAEVQAAIADELGSHWLGPSAHVGVSVRDVGTGEHLVDQHADRPMTPASLVKLLTAAAVVTTLPMGEGFATTVVAGPEPDVVVLRAGGDMLLARGAGDPESVAGHAGLGDLADQVVAALEPRGVGSEERPVRLWLDTTYADGPSAPSGWTDYWLQQGYAGPITMLGTVPDRAGIGHRAPREPAQEAAQDFRAALVERGVVVSGSAPVPRAPVDVAGNEPLATVVSAPAGEVLALALGESDNALVEQLARQAAVLDGADPDPASVADWVVGQVHTYGVDTTGLELADAAGLSPGSTIPVRVVSDLLVEGGNGAHPALQAAFSELPVAGYTGTLWDRFHLPVHDPAVGVARAKTGSLPGVSALAGYVVTDDGRLLAFTLIAQRVGEDWAAVEARSVLDEVVAELARCGC